jgi:hypothetical protein
MPGDKVGRGGVAAVKIAVAGAKGGVKYGNGQCGVGKGN